MKAKYNVYNEELGIDYADCGPWRSYHLTASGNTLAELVKDATVSEVGQDGEDFKCYDVLEGNAPAEAALEYLEKLTGDKYDSN